MSATDRLVALMDHLRLGSAYFGTAIPRDIAGLAIAHPERLAGIVLCVPSRLDPAPFSEVADQVLMIAGERGPAAEATARATARLPAAQRRFWPVTMRQAAGAMPSPTAPTRSPTGQSLFSTVWPRMGSARRRLVRPRRREACRHFLPRRGLRPYSDAAAVSSRALAMGARNPAFSPALHGRDPGQAAFGRRCLARGPRPDADLSGDVPKVDRPDRATARRGDLEIGCGAGSLVRLLERRLGDANPIQGGAAGC